VVFDTTGNPKVDRELRGIIARELGRSDFKLIINTHGHGDHTGGNEVYADCTIVGHESVAEEMAAQSMNRSRSIEWCSTRGGELRQQLATPPADPVATAKLREEAARLELNLANLKSEAKSCPPTKTFKDRLQLKMGDTNFELYYIGGMHSSGDIAIFVPEKGLLLTGDTMADAWRSDTPGCLASFMARPSVAHDFPRLLANWDALLAKKSAIKQILTGHWNGDLSYPGFAARVEYVRTLWDGVNRGIKEGKDLQALQAEFDLNSRFPELANSPGFAARNTNTTILEMWATALNVESAAERLYALVDEGADESAIRQVVASQGAQPPKYYFIEAQINGSGYRFLQAGESVKAVALFKANVELFPGSWNVYDSLGEALLAAGDTEQATRMYEKSLALNPDSQSGKDALARIRGEGTAQ